MRITPVLLFLACAACGGDEERPPNVLILSLDTLRADRLGCYGSDRELTPNLDSLANSAVLWERCAASSPWTVPSHASMFTGRDPHAHGAHSFEVDDMTVDNCYTLPEEHPTIAEVLAREGYDTGGIVANAVYLNPSFGMDRGFASWTMARERAPRLVREALEWIDARENRPWVLFLNFMDTHRPYNVEPIPGEESFDQATEFSSQLLDELYRRVIVEGREPGTLAVSVQRQYDRAVRNLDLALGELFEALVERRVWDETIVVVTSDHGEYFGEHSLVEHSKDVYEAAVSVPLLIKAARQTEPERSAERASNAHLPGLILERLPQRFQGEYGDVFPKRPGTAPVITENYYSRLPDILHPEVGARFKRVRSALYDGQHKLIRSSDGELELYDLSLDPQELSDLSDVDVDRLRSMSERLEALLAGNAYGRERGTVELDAARLEELHGFGYAGQESDD